MKITQKRLIEIIKEEIESAQSKPFDDGDGKDEKCDYVDCENEKKLGESNCGNHNEDLDESYIVEDEIDENYWPERGY